MKRREVNVLIVDDNPSDRALIAANLKYLGFTKIQQAENGKVAEFKLTNAETIDNPFDLVLLDWNMPASNGLALLKFVKSQSHLRSTILFVVTAAASTNRVEDAMANGAKDFVVKPITHEVLEQKLKIYFPADK